MPADLMLDDFGVTLRHAFGHMPYHVGSSLKLKTGWRDVDVRVMLPDQEWDALGLGDPTRTHENGRWCAWVTAFSLLGKQMTGLPIDFQLQRRTQANEDFVSTIDHPRSALSIVASAGRSIDFQRDRAAR